MTIQQQQGDEERRRAEEEAALAESLKTAAYADYYGRRDRAAILNGTGGSDYSFVGRSVYTDTTRGHVKVYDAKETK